MHSLNFLTFAPNLSPPNWSEYLSPPPSQFLTQSHHLVYLSHPTPSKSTITVAIVTRGRGACCHRISPGPSHPVGTTDCSHCWITELLRLQALGRGQWEGSDMSSNEGNASAESICVNKQVGTHALPCKLFISPHFNRPETRVCTFTIALLTVCTMVW